MPEYKSVSPLLDNILIGEAISEHHGTTCCPAINDLTGKKYILKIISVPASQNQTDALLLAGVLKDREDAVAYYEDRVSALTKDIDALQLLSRNEGFLSFTGYQVVKKDDCPGFDIYILSDYTRSLQRQFEKKPLTKLDAINLGLDICSALAACRRSGYLFINLKPSNIFIAENGEFRICDLGFIPLNSLRYASIEEHYISGYTAPEIEDAYSTLNNTLDVYAIGSILYEIFNGGVMPEKISSPPEYADEEIGNIILKACAASPDDRWQDPAEMGQALVAYMQKNGADAVPIIPVIPQVAVPDTQEAVSSFDETENDDLPTEEAVSAVLSADDTEITLEDPQSPTPIAENADIPEEPDIQTAPIEQDSAQNEPILDPYAEIPLIQPKMDEITLDEFLSMIDNAIVEDSQPSILPEQTASDEMAQDAPPAPIQTDDLSFEEAAEMALPPQEESEPTQDDDMQVAAVPIPEPQAGEVTEDITEQDTIVIPPSDPLLETDTVTPEEPDREASEEGQSVQDEVLYAGISQEVNDILMQADSLADMVVPDPVIPAVSDTQSEIICPEPEENTQNDNKENIDMTSSEMYDNEYFSQVETKQKKHWVRNVIIIAILLSLLAGCYLFYRFVVLKNVTQFQISGIGDTVSVQVLSNANENLLYVSCKDPTGTTVTVPIKNGTAEFSKLSPSTQYSVSLHISGLHVLNGTFIENYTTPAASKVIPHPITIGDTSGTVIIEFDVEGTDCENWSFVYATEGEPEKTASFVGHKFVLNGLKENAPYTGTLVPEKHIIVNEGHNISFIAETLVQANNLKIVACSNSMLTAKWDAPFDDSSEVWIARCYSENGYDQTLTTTNTTVTFTDLNSSDAYCVEVWARGQTIKQTDTVEANSITVTDLSADLSTAGLINLSWKSTQLSDNGWTVRYTINDSEKIYELVCDETHAIISPAVPGCKYTFTVEAISDVSTFCDPHICNIPDAIETFSIEINNQTITKDDLQIDICKRPDLSSWSSTDLTEDSYTNIFAPTDKAGFLLFLIGKYESDDERIEITTVISDEDMKIVDVFTDKVIWSSMWKQNSYGLSIPQLPETPGYYKITVYFNNQILIETDFTVQ